VLAKLMGFGVTAFVFDATREQLLQMAWFGRMHDQFLHAQTEKVRQCVLQLTWLLKPLRAGKFLRRLTRLHRRAYRSRPA
jgi:hypothetical protein